MKVYPIYFLILFWCCKTGGNSILASEDIAINVLDFGALPGDKIDDSEAIQAAIDFAIKSRKSSWVYCPPGIYHLSKGLVIANQQKSGEFKFVTLRIGGAIPVYSENQTVGSVAVFKIKNPTFGIALQSARNCTIENLVFLGCSKLENSPEAILARSAKNLKKEKSIRTNRYSPSCALVIDPFAYTIQKENQYPGFSDFYTNRKRSGSSMVLIRGCTFDGHYIALANNPSAYIQNGDNIRIENSHAKRIHTFWSAGQTQSRTNSIDNVYCTGVHTFISGRQIGGVRGTPPTIRNVSIAGFCKQLLNLKTGFSGFSAYQSNFESLWSLGVSNTTWTSFNQCHIKFFKPTREISVPQYHFRSNSILSFNDCDIIYFSNCKLQIPFVFKSMRVNITGGNIEGGLVFADQFTNRGGEQLHNVSFRNVRHKCFGSVLSDTYTGVIPNKMNGKFVPGNVTVVTASNKVYKQSRNTYKLENRGKFQIKEGDKGTIYLVGEGVAKLNINDNLIVAKNFTLKKVKPALGFVQGKDSEKVFLVGCPKEVIGHTVLVSKCSLYKISKVDLE